MKNTAIMGGIAVAILLVLGLRKDRKSVVMGEVMDEKIQALQSKFKSLDAA